MKRTRSGGEVWAPGLGPVCPHWAFSKTHFSGEEMSRRNNIQGPGNVQDWAWALGVQRGVCLLCMLLFRFDSPASHMIPQAPEIMIPVHRHRTKLWESPVVVKTRKRKRAGTAVIQSSKTPEIVASTVIYPGSPHSLGTGSASPIYYRKAHSQRPQAHSDLHVDLGCLLVDRALVEHFFDSICWRSRHFQVSLYVLNEKHSPWARIGQFEQPQTDCSYGTYCKNQSFSDISLLVSFHPT